MVNYLLLRNNKESGPYSLDDLMKLGLKAYDLVWVQGKSAAWRYPSEVDELKPYAPAVEEQPFDRFFKKPSESRIDLTGETKQPIKKEIPVIAPEHEKYIPKKSVFVTMPGQKNGTHEHSVKKEEFIPSAKKAEPIPAPVQQTITISENPVAAQTKYSQPLDDIKEMYVKTLHERKQKIARKNFRMQSLKKTAVILLLIAVGVIAGWIIKSNGEKKEVIAQSKETIQNKPVNQELTVTLPDTNKIATTIEEENILPPPSGGFITNNALKEKPEPTVDIKKSIEKPLNSEVKKETQLSSSENVSSNGMLNRGVDIDPVTGERTRKVREGTNESVSLTNSEAGKQTTSAYSGELAGLVSVKSNEYKKVAFGGIRDLQLTVTNDSKYILDNVTVELQYIKPNELPLKAEHIQFRSVAPNGTSTIRIPDTNRGIKVNFRITNIKSRQMDEGVAGN